MCTVVVLRRPGHPWPLLLAANRDEMKTRPWRPPGRHWADRPEIVAGMDELAGGAWLGLNDRGVVAGVLNRVGSLGPQSGKRSRGELVLRALGHGDASAAATAISLVEPGDYRSFNLVVADQRSAYWVRHGDPDAGAGTKPAGIQVFEIPPGLSMLTARERNDPTSPRIRGHLARFEAANPPDPRTGRWGAWKRLLASRKRDPGEGPEAAMTVVTEAGFETVSSSLIALPGPPQSLKGKVVRPVWLFAAGRPDQNPYRPVDL